MSSNPSTPFIDDKLISIVDVLGRKAQTSLAILATASMSWPPDREQDRDFFQAEHDLHEAFREAARRLADVALKVGFRLNWIEMVLKENRDEAYARMVRLFESRNRKSVLERALLGASHQGILAAKEVLADSWGHYAQQFELPKPPPAQPEGQGCLALEEPEQRDGNYSAKQISDAITAVRIGTAPYIPNDVIMRAFNISERTFRRRKFKGPRRGVKYRLPVLNALERELKNRE